MLNPSVFRQLNTSMAVSQMSAVQCRLAPLIQVIQDCSHLYHYAVKLMFKLHSCESLGMCSSLPGSGFWMDSWGQACVDGCIHHHVPVSHLGSKETCSNQLPAWDFWAGQHQEPRGYFEVPVPASHCPTSLVPTPGMGTPHSCPDHSHLTPTWPLPH